MLILCFPALDYTCVTLPQLLEKKTVVRILLKKRANWGETVSPPPLLPEKKWDLPLTLF